MFTINGKPNCKWCEKAKELLDDLGLEYKYVNVMDNLYAKDKVKRDGFTTVPAIYLGDSIIGGYEVLKKWVDNQ